MTTTPFNIYQQFTSVRVASESNLLGAYYNGNLGNGVGSTLTSISFGSLTIDGVVLSVGDRVLLYAQTNTNENGIYVVVNTGSDTTFFILKRSNDCQSVEQLSPGQYVSVGSGDSLEGSIFVLVEPVPLRIGISPFIFINVSPEIVSNSAYGSYGLTNNIGNTSFVSSNVFYPASVSSGFTSVNNSNMTSSLLTISGVANSPAITYNGEDPQFFEVDINFAVRGGVAQSTNYLFAIGIYSNTGTVTTTLFQSSLLVSDITTINDISLSGIVELNSGDSVFIQISNISNTNAIVMRYINAKAVSINNGSGSGGGGGGSGTLQDGYNNGNGSIQVTDGKPFAVKDNTNTTVFQIDSIGDINLNKLTVSSLVAMDPSNNLISLPNYGITSKFSVTTTPQSMSLNSRYINNYAVGKCIYTLPAATGSGKLIDLVSLSTASTLGWIVNAIGTDVIQFGSSVSAAAGNLQSTINSATDCATFLDISPGKWLVYPALGLNLIVT